MAGGGRGEARFGREGVQGEDARVEQEGKLERRGGFQDAHGVSAAVRGFVAAWKRVSR